MCSDPTRIGKTRQRIGFPSKVYILLEKTTNMQHGGDVLASWLYFMTYLL